MERVLLIAVGGGAGAVLRYALSGVVQRAGPEGFPVGTLAVNVLGCLFAGFLGAALVGPWMVREEHRIAIMIGLLGGMTTFSTFGLETVMMLNGGQAARAAAYIALSNLLGVGAVLVGYRLSEKLLGV